MRAMKIPVMFASVIAASPASAFQPNDAGHLGITSDALAPMSRTADGNTYRFSEAAIFEIRDHNRNVDIFEFHVEEAHFDNESLDSGSSRLIDLKEEIVQLLLASPPDGEEARETLGAALHTVQDFYSHSNWVELGMTAFDPALGRGMLTPLAMGIATCPASPDVLDPALVDRTTGYYLLPNPCLAPAGKCLHGVQFFCAGINKDAPGRAGYPEAYAIAVGATEDYVAQILDDPRIAANPAALAAFMGAQAGDPPAPELILSLRSGVEALDPRRFKLPVDSTIAQLVVTVEVSGAPATRVRRPSGASISAGEPGVTIVASPTAYRAVIDDPEDGAWLVEIAGTGTFSLRAAGASPLALDRFDFVTVGGSVGHEGFVPLAITPAKHSSALALSRVTGAPATQSFAVIDEKGKLISSVSMSSDPRAGSGERVGAVAIPNKRFRVRVSGADASGRSYQRVTETLYVPSR